MYIYISSANSAHIMVNHTFVWDGDAFFNVIQMRTSVFQDYIITTQTGYNYVCARVCVCDYDTLGWWTQIIYPSIPNTKTVGYQSAVNIDRVSFTFFTAFILCSDLFVYIHRFIS